MRWRATIALLIDLPNLRWWWDCWWWWWQNWANFSSLPNSVSALRMRDSVFGCFLFLTATTPTEYAPLGAIRGKSTSIVSSVDPKLSALVLITSIACHGGYPDYAWIFEPTTHQARSVLLWLHTTLLPLAGAISSANWQWILSASCTLKCHTTPFPNWQLYFAGVWRDWATLHANDVHIDIDLIYFDCLVYGLNILEIRLHYSTLLYSVMSLVINAIIEKKQIAVELACTDSQ